VPAALFAKKYKNHSKKARIVHTCRTVLRMGLEQNTNTVLLTKALAKVQQEDAEVAEALQGEIEYVEEALQKKKSKRNRNRGGNNNKGAKAQE
jgi:hypothetical protein